MKWDQAHGMRPLTMCRTIGTCVGASLLKRLTIALPGSVEHSAELYEMESVISKNNAQELETWKEEMGAWEADRSLPNPFSAKGKGACPLKQVLAQEVAQDSEVDGIVLDESLQIDATMHASVMIGVGLQAGIDDVMSRT